MSERRTVQIAEAAHQAVQQETEQLPTTGAVSYREAGPAEGRAVVFLHGIGGGATGFEPQLGAFAAAGYRAIAWDMPGHGGSAPLPLVTMGALAAALGAFLARLGLDRPVLVGHSLGGMVVLALLAKAPHCAGAVVLSQTSAAFGGKDPAWAEAFVAERLGPLDAGHSLRELAPRMIAAMVAPDADPAGIEIARAALADTPAASYRDTVLAMPGFDARGTLPGIVAPVLVIAGALDPAAPPSGMARMAAAIPGAQTVVLEGVGHLAHLERPGAFNRAVLDFLSTAAPA